MKISSKPIDSAPTAQSRNTAGSVPRSSVGYVAPSLMVTDQLVFWALLLEGVRSPTTSYTRGVEYIKTATRRMTGHRLMLRHNHRSGGAPCELDEDPGFEPVVL